MALRITLSILFVLSGAAGLVYESLWARYLGLFVGHSAYAQIIVLGIFLGGMAAGALVTGRVSVRLRDPLRWYARAELAIGVMGIAFHAVYRFVTEAAYETVFPALGTGIGLLIAKWAIAGALILPQSIVLGATFPLMTAALLRRDPDRPGRSLAILYFANSFGAAIGVLLAGFWLLALSGLPGTLLIAGGVNLLVAAASLLVAARYPVTAPVPAAPVPAARDDGEDPTARALPQLLLLVAFGTAVASFIYEIGWIRMLSLVVGSATHSFELMLSAFILGLALGSFWVRTRADRWRDPVRALGIVQWLMGAAALATLPLYTASFEWMAVLMSTFARTDNGYTAFALARYAISLAIMLPATFCAGVTLPLITRILVVRRMGEEAIGRVYGLNTLGSIVGVAAGGLLLMPWFGLKATLVVGGGLDMALGAYVLYRWAALSGALRTLAAAASIAAVAVVLAAGVTGNFDRRLLASSVYRDGVIPAPESFESISHQDGRTASVSVFRRPETGVMLIATNGKPDASLPPYWTSSCTDATVRRPLDSDAATQTLAPLITLAHRPDARNAAVIGMGSGMSSHFMLGAPALDEVVTIEIEPAMVRGARAFYPANRRVYDDPRSRIVYDDAKSFFAASREQFDIIVSEPSNPWVSGVANLFSTEFYARVRGYLTERGVFGQWLHLYEINDRLVLSVLAAIHQNFRSYVVYQTWNADMVIVASNAGRLPNPAWSVFDLPGIADDLCHTVPMTARMLDATRLLDRDALEPLLGRWSQINSDFYPQLDLGTERTRYLRTRAQGLIDLSAARFDFTTALTQRRLPPTDQTRAPVPRIPRMQALAVSAAVRAADGDGTDAAPPDPAATRARHLMQRWEATLARERPPPDWKLWLDEMAAVERAVHGAVRGFVDERFYGRIDRYLERTNAPPGVRSAVAFRHGLASWDFAEVQRAGDALLQHVLDRGGYIAAAEYLDGMIAAKLRVGQPAVARRLLETLRPMVPRPPTDLRMLLLDAYTSAALATAGAGRPDP